MCNSFIRRALLASIVLLTVVVGSAACAPKSTEPEEIQARRDDGGAPGATNPDDPTLDGDAPSPPEDDPRAPEMHARADRELATMMLRFWPLIRDNNNPHYWAFTQHWDVVIDGAERLGPSAFRGTVRMFFDLQNSRGWIRDGYDVENWMVLTLIRAYGVTGEPSYLAKARELFGDVMGGWDETCCGPNKGGIWWRKAKDAKITGVNAGAVVSAARLYEHTKDPSYLAFAKKVYEFWSKNMVDQASGKVFDSMSAAGVINTEASFIYNEGLMIGAVVALAKAEGDPSRLELAHKIASYMMTKQSGATSIGTILSDGKCGQKGGVESEQFKGIGMRYLAQLYLADPSHSEYKEFLVRSAEAIWTLARDSGTGLVSCDWAGPYNPDTNSIHSLSSAATALAAAARVLGPATPRPALEFEAEESNLFGTGLEGNHVGFQGWGYAAGWGEDGERVEFVVDVEAAGTYDAELRYASGGPASRRVALNGKTVAANLSFPTTGGYENYMTLTTPLTLTAGRNVVTIIFDLNSGSSNFINLDRVRFIPK